LIKWLSTGPAPCSLRPFRGSLNVLEVRTSKGCQMSFEGKMFLAQWS